MNNGGAGDSDYNNNTTARYEDIMGLVADNPTDDREQKMAKATEALSQRLALFKKWLTDEANVTMHPAICVVNGEATDGTRNAPLLAFELPTEEEKTAGAVTDESSSSAAGESRLGRVDGEGEQSLYEKNIGCQIRTTREIKKDDTMMTIPRASMVTPDLVAVSDAGRAVLACCSGKPNSSSSTDAEGQTTGFWDAFTNTTEYEQKFNNIKSTGPQSLMKILQERKKVEARVAQRYDEGNPTVKLAEFGTVSTRAPLLAFLIHQRFSNQHRPPVSSLHSESLEEAKTSDNGNALRGAKSLDPLEGRPETFGPYARTLPSVVPMPLCWKRNELALLTGCIPGLGILQEVAAQTIMLASEFLALLEGGIMERFPDIFPPGVLTWDRWVWAASIVTSRILPAPMYFNAGDSDPEMFKPTVPEEFQSTPEVWRELGVLVPLLDMLNHEIDANQVTFKPCKPEKSADEAKDSMDDDDEEPHPPMAIFHRKVKKGSEVFIAYGKLSNHSMILRYGMAQMNNFYEEVKIGFSLGESVGGISPPSDYTPTVEDAPCVFETTDAAAIDEWWTPDRLSLLQREAGLNQSIIASLQQGKKMQTVAYNDGAYHPNLIAACLVATVPAANVAELAKGENSGIPVSKPHLNALRNYLAFLLKQKVEKLLQNLESGLKAHFTDLELWKKASDGGIRYVPGEGASSNAIGWQSFFDRYAYQSSMEVEKNYYAMGPDSCVLTLYDGQLRTLQNSLDGIVDSEKFQTGLVQQLEELGYTMVDHVEPSPGASAKQNPPDKKVSPGRKKRNKKKSSGGNGPVGSATGSSGGDKPPALKLHVGNLSYSTTPSDLYDYFSSLYGKEHVLECHIPIERASRRSRGFGFVTMPESIAEKVLVSNQKHEIDGRLLKVAKSNSAGTSDATRSLPGPPPVPSDRCVKCGYRPKYCECNVPNLPSGAGPPPPYFPPHFPPEPRGRDSPGYHSEPRHMSPDRIRDDYYRYERDRYRDDHHRRRDYDRYDRDYDGDYDRDHYDRDYDIDRDRYRYREGSPRYMDYDRDERRSRSERSRERRRDRSRERSRESRSPSRRRDDERRRDRDRERERERRPPPDDPDWDRERDRKRSRSRSRERSRKKKSKKREA